MWYNIESTNTMLVCRRKGGQNVTDRQDSVSYTHLGSHGYYHLEDKRIAINEGMSELQTLTTAIHEIAHAKLHLSLIHI